MNEIGERVVLFVRKENPNDVIIDTFLERWLVITIVGAIGAVFVFVMILLIIISRKAWLARFFYRDLAKYFVDGPQKLPDTLKN